jgi:exopolyphosphatase/guanosine-5'-triphosphate,3'-diphosphate pyrophosphatase
VRIAALDLGSNSFHLVVVEATRRAPDPEIRVVDRAREMVRLGEATLLTGIIPTDGFERGLDALARLREVAARHAPEAFLVAATSAIREASNGDAFARAAREALGVDVRVIDGHEEARLVYYGARGPLALEGRRVALFDLGGGSLELILADARAILFSASFKLGVLRLKDRWLAQVGAGAVGAAALSPLREAVRRELTPAVARVREQGFDFVAFTAGTARALLAMAEALPAAGTAAPPAPALTVAALARLEALLAALPADERAALPGVDRRRVDTLLPGAIVLRTALELCGAAEGTVCETALREGMIAAYLAGEW